MAARRTIAIALYLVAAAGAAAGPQTIGPQTIGPQTIAFLPLPGRIFGTGPFLVTAQASSHLPVTFSSDTPAVCKVVSGLVTLTAPGACTLAAAQTGNSAFSAVTVRQTFTVSAANISGGLSSAAGSPFPLGANSYSVAVADFNGDGFLDMASANGGANNVTVLLGDGHGGFATAPGSPFASGSGPLSLAIGDFDGDGAPDLAVAGATTGAGVTVLLGDGAGGFVAASGSPFAAGTFAAAQALAVGDFNEDGMADLVVADRVNGTLLTLLGNGKGGFTLAPGMPVSLGAPAQAPAALAVADFNGDGLLDLATANQISGNVTILLGNGVGGFTPFGSLRSGAQPFAIVTGDFNGDGKADLVTADNAGNSVTVFLGNGSGGFTQAAGSPISVASPWSVAVADIDGDGDQDIVVGSAGTGITLLSGNGKGGFTPVPGSLGSGIPISVAVADFNQDGSMDIAAANYGLGTVSVFLGGLAITKASLTTSAATTVPLGQAVPLSVTVTNSGIAFGAPTGIVTVRDGSTVLGKASQTSSPWSYTATGLKGGTHNLSASYSGDTRSLASVSNTVVVNEGGPTPVITSLAPAAWPVGGPDLSVTVNGANFVAASLVQWNTQSNTTVLSTKVIGPTQLSATVPAALMAVPATPSVVVVNPGGSVSNPIPFGEAPPVLSTLAPASATAGGKGFALCVTGTGFSTGSTVEWNTSGLQTTFKDAANLCASVPAALIASPGGALIWILSSDGIASASLLFQINTPPPAPPPPAVPVPTINSGGIVPIYSSNPVVQPGSWASVFGSTLATGTYTWAGDFPTSLGGVSVTVNDKPAYLWSVSPTQINLQAPDDASVGAVKVVVTSPTGTATSTVTLAPVSPSFSLLSAKYPAGVILTPNGSGAYGGGTYDLMGPTGAFSFGTRPVKTGEILSLYGVGFGATNPPVPAGAAFSGNAPSVVTPVVTVGGTPATVLYSGLIGAGLFQITFIVPKTASGDQLVLAKVGAAPTQSGIYVTVK